MTQFDILKILEDNPKIWFSNSSIAAIMDIKPSNIAAKIRALEKMGLIELKTVSATSYAFKYRPQK